MKHLPVAGLLTLTLLLSAAASVSSAKPAAKTATKQSQTPAPAPDADQAKTTPLPILAFPGGVTMTQMVFYTLPGFRPLSLDLYLPPGKGAPKANPLPGLVFVHGGGWNSGDPRHDGAVSDFPKLLAEIAARGFVVASIDYRLSGEARFPAALTDVKTAIRWLRQHAKDENLDDTRIAVWGTEAGGQLAALAGVSCGVATLEPETDTRQSAPSDCVQAVIDWSGITDLESMAADLDKPAPDKSFAGDYLGCEPALCAIALAHNASPMAYIETMNPPFLIQHGGADSHVSPKQSQKLYDALHAKNIPAELVIYPGVGQDFDGANGAPDPAAVKQAVEKLEAFLDTTFPKKPADGPSKAPKRKASP